MTALSGGSERRAVRQQFKARDLRVRQAQAGAGRLLSDRGLPDVLLPRRRHLLQDEQPAGGLRDGLGLQGHGGQGRDGVRAGRERDLRAALVPRRLGRGACGAPPGAAAPARTMTRRRGGPAPRGPGDPRAAAAPPRASPRVHSLAPLGGDGPRRRGAARRPARRRDEGPRLGRGHGERPRVRRGERPRLGRRVARGRVAEAPVAVRRRLDEAGHRGRGRAAEERGVDGQAVHRVGLRARGRVRAHERAEHDGRRADGHGDVERRRPGRRRRPLRLRRARLRNEKRTRRGRRALRTRPGNRSRSAMVADRASRRPARCGDATRAPA